MRSLYVIAQRYFEPANDGDSDCTTAYGQRGAGLRLLESEKGVTQVIGGEGDGHTKDLHFFPRLSYYPAISHAFLLELELALFEWVRSTQEADQAGTR